MSGGWSISLRPTLPAVLRLARECRPFVITSDLTSSIFRAGRYEPVRLEGRGQLDVTQHSPKICRVSGVHTAGAVVYLGHAYIHRLTKDGEVPRWGMAED